MDFAETNVYKSRQVEKLAGLVKRGKVKPGDRLLFADAWHPGVINARYMSDLLGLGVTIDVMWHSGSYDRDDQLGKKIREKAWVRAFEKSVYHAASRNYFATEFHRSIFLKGVDRDSSRSRVVGWPMEYLPQLLAAQASRSPKDVILFPHRMAAEQQPEALKRIQSLLPGYEIVFAQEAALSKADYHDHLSGHRQKLYAALEATYRLTFELEQGSTLKDFVVSHGEKWGKVAVANPFQRVVKLAFGDAAGSSKSKREAEAVQAA